nr:beta-catenin-like protein 1 [Ipomoea batatas]GMC96877.1 beta-catenin-like protein 1 [Ipomoea batatas]
MEMSNHNSKRKRDADDYDEDDNRPAPPGVSNGEIDLSLLEALEKSQQNAVEALDLKTVKKLVLSFERRLKENIAARLKYPDQPEKFADSEVELHDEIQKLKVLAGGPEFYPELVNLGTVASITSLLNHDNTDIAIDVVALLQDLTDEDVLEDNDEPAQVLVDALIENNALELLVQNLSRLSDADPDESAAIYNTLATIENFIEVKPSVSELVCERTKIMKWLLGRLKVKEFDSNKQYASEILAILLQNSSANQKRLGQMNGVDAILQAVAAYKSKDPKTSDEEELVENLFDSLCCLLMPLENKERFVKSEGVELMIIIMNQKKLCYGSAIRALDFAMTNYPPACERFVDVMGLKTAFPAFMDSIEQKEQEALQGRIGRASCITSCVIICLTISCGILRGSRRDRLLSKFVENECEKIDRLMELYIRYSDRVKKEAAEFDQLELDDLEMDEDEKYNRKLEVGLYTLQLIAVILGHLWTSEHPRIRARIELLLKQLKLTKQDVKDILQEYHDNIGDFNGPEEKERTQSKIQRFISAF